MKKWFVLSQGQVNGPFLTEEVEGKVANDRESQVWSRGETEWIGIDKWHHHLTQAKTKPASLPTETDDDDHWRIKIGGKELEPMTYTQSLKKLKEYKEHSGIRIYDKKSKEWKDFFQFENFLKDLGISRRNHDRVPILGSFIGEHNRLGTMQVKVITISEGGFGVGDAKDFQIGDEMTGTIQSPNLYLPIHCTADIVYLSPEGIVGLQFKSIPEEAHAAIVEYVKKFTALKSKS